MKSERVEILVCGFEWCILNAKKVLSWNKFRKMKCLCNRWVFVWNPCTLKEMVQFVHEVYPVFVVILSTFAHILCGSNDTTLPSFNLFWVQLYSFPISRLFSSKYIIKCMKNRKEVWKCWNLRMWIWMVHIECKKSVELK